MSMLYRYVITIIFCMLLQPPLLWAECCNDPLSFIEINYERMFSVERGSVCSCGSPPEQRWGTIIEFWEPVAVIDTVSRKYCAPARIANFDSNSGVPELRDEIGDVDPDLDASHLGADGAPDIFPDTAGTRAGNTDANVPEEMAAVTYGTANADAPGNIPGLGALGNLLSGVGSPTDLLGAVQSGLGDAISFINPESAQNSDQGNTTQTAIGDLLGHGTKKNRDRNRSKQDMTFLYAHLYRPIPILTAIAINDFRCVESSILNITDYVSENDAAWESPAIASFLDFLIVSPIFIAIYAGDEALTAVVADIFADTVSSQFGYPNDLAPFNLGAWGFKYPLCGYTSHNDYSAANAAVAVRAAEIGAQTGRILNTTTSTCHATFFPLLQKRHFKLQIIRPTLSDDLITIGQTAMLWGLSDNPVFARCKDNYSWILWRRRICCGYF